MSDFRENLTRLMKEKGFNMKSLSLAASGGETLIRDILVRKRSPRQDKLADIAKALGCSVADLYEGADCVTSTASNTEEKDPKEITAINEELLHFLIVRVLNTLRNGDASSERIAGVILEVYKKYADRPQDALKHKKKDNPGVVVSDNDLIKIVE